MTPICRDFREFVTAAIVSVVFFAAFLFSDPLPVSAADTDSQLLKDAQSNFEPISTTAKASDKHPAATTKVELGRQLFFDPRMSADGTTSCMRCHQAGLFATDALAKSHGARDFVLPRNAPTVFNTGLYFKIHWDGGFDDVEAQAKHALIGPAFGNANFDAAMQHIKSIPGYADIFKAAFPNDKDPVTPGNWGTAIGAFERTLLTPSRFDDYLRGKPDALSAAERKGLRTFIDTGCSDCHNGAGVGGNDLQTFGVYKDYWTETHSKEIDKGRFGITKDKSDLYVFKTPGLRNVEMTPPYFHDGSVDTLPRAVQIMGKVQLHTTLSDADPNDIVTFLKSLTGKMPESFEKAPRLPEAAFSPPPDSKHPQ
jgi:cytochrome c peroxidase